MSLEACCTCATLLADAKVPYDRDSEKPLLYNRRLSCCSREICALCQTKNPRFQNYCPFCQISSGPSALPKEGLRLPPSYSRKPTSTNAPTPRVSRDSPPPPPSPPPPSYDEATLPSHSHLRQGREASSSSSTATTTTSASTSTTKSPPTGDDDTDDTIHHVGVDDTLQSLSLAYNVPVAVLRRHNNLYSDPLLAARKWVLIPRSHYAGPPLSTPPDAEEEARKTKLRRWMVATKCADYAVATLYLKGADHDLDLAVQAFRADEEWERNHPLEPRSPGGRGNGASDKGKNKVSKNSNNNNNNNNNNNTSSRGTRRVTSTLSGQLS
ncbi:hypothetical protein PV08_03224 [Exophiala spinifera]|uniref:LysM domain-containing protein n=1 Tax=Exophiala spinifera TaxID=91928 RepID=A0A0D2BK36_9EURO|nr:uncharacterized protein PV08_03224 [Exophiala spinifera]KIW18935.1 hypothetical protein PV08_03224 [Exophiala spinifera]